MAVFEYKGLKRKGKKVSGMVDADSRQAANSKLRSRDIYPTALYKIESIPEGKSRILEAVDDSFRWFTRVKSAELSMMTRQLSTLLSAGFPLVRALMTLVPQTRSRVFQRILSRVKDAVEEGNSFANALALYPGVFSPVYINMVRAGESSGTLEIVLERLADVTEKREETKKQIQAALAYPVLMSLLGAVILIILLTYVVPGIVGIFSDMNQVLPAPTRILISVSDFFKFYWWALASGVLLCISGMIFLRKTRKGAYLIDRILISLPLGGILIKKLVTARVARTLASLLDNGVPMLISLNITKSISGNLVIHELIDTASKNVEQGGEMGRILEESPYFPFLAAQMIKVGEASGEIGKMLEKTADLYEKDVQTAVTAAASLISPIIILIMGVIVALIILSICLPIFEINQLIG